MHWILTLLLCTDHYVLCYPGTVHNEMYISFPLSYCSPYKALLSCASKDEDKTKDQSFLQLAQVTCWSQGQNPALMLKPVMFGNELYALAYLFSMTGFHLSFPNFTQQSFVACLLWVTHMSRTDTGLALVGLTVLWR